MKIGCLGVHRNHFPLREIDHLREGNPAGALDQHFIARIDQGHDRVEDRMLASYRDGALRWVVARAEVGFNARADRLSERSDATSCGVSRKILIESALRRGL